MRLEIGEMIIYIYMCDVGKRLSLTIGIISALAQIRIPNGDAAECRRTCFVDALYSGMNLALCHGSSDARTW